MLNQKPTSESEWTILKLLKWSTAYFQSRKVEDPRASAEILLAHTLNLERIDLYVRYDQPLTRSELAYFKGFLQRRLKREPVAYIVGEKEFWSMSLVVSKDVLIPRPETECLVEAALSYLPEPPTPVSTRGSRRVLELGTGSGAVILALASLRPSECYFASDCSVRAVEAAKSNARRHHLEARVAFVSGDWFAPFRSAQGFDLIVSNPPYIPTPDIPGLQPEISKHEPMVALDGGRDGLVCLRRIIDSAWDYLNCGGMLLLEIGHFQKTELERIIGAHGGYEAVSFIKDYGGHHRVLQMRRKPNREQAREQVREQANDKPDIKMTDSKLRAE